MKKRLMDPKDEKKKRAPRIRQFTKSASEILKVKMNEDPLVKLGFGICAYRGILWALIWTFAIFSILVIPSRLIFKHGNAYVNLSDSMRQNESLTLGNLGYSSVNCVSMPIEVGKIQISCNYGSIGQVFAYGVSNLSDNNPYDQCSVN